MSWALLQATSSLPKAFSRPTRMYTIVQVLQQKRYTRTSTLPCWGTTKNLGKLRSIAPQAYSLMHGCGFEATPEIALTVSPGCRELFVDGTDETGKRVYDKVNGMTCHQCRQKTLGKHTSCSCCSSLQVQSIHFVESLTCPCENAAFMV